MLRSITGRRLGGLALVALLAAGGPLMARQQRTPDTPRDADRPADRADRGGDRDRPTTDQEGDRLQVHPEGWAQVAIDYDGDGRVDRVETIFLLDLEQASRASAIRRQMMSGAMNSSPAAGAGRRAIDRVTGTLTGLHETTLAGMGDEPHLLGRVETDEGRKARVHLGAKSKIDEAGIEEGDTVTVAGVRGLINDRPMLMARRVESNGRFVDVELPEDRALRRIQGEVVSTRTIDAGDRGGTLVVATLKLRNGREYPAILGPEGTLGDVELADGDTLTLLARPGRLNGQPALIAEQLRAGDRTIVVEEPDRSDFGRSGDQRQSPSNQPSRSNQPERSQD